MDCGVEFNRIASAESSDWVRDRTAEQWALVTARLARHRTSRATVSDARASAVGDLAHFVSALFAADSGTCELLRHCTDGADGWRYMTCLTARENPSWRRASVPPHISVEFYEGDAVMIKAITKYLGSGVAAAAAVLVGGAIALADPPRVEPRAPGCRP